MNVFCIIHIFISGIEWGFGKLWQKKKVYYNLYTYELKSNQSYISLLRPLIHDEKTLP